MVAFVIVPAVVVAALHVIVRRLVPPERLAPHHEVAGFLVAIVGVLYAVVLGFLVVTVWSSFQSVQSDADLEAFSLGDAYGFAGALPEPQRSGIRRDLARYALEVRDVEWERLAHDQPDERARALLIHAFRQMATVPIPNDEGFGTALRQQSLVNDVVDSLHQVWDHRRLRLTEAHSHLAPALYLAIVLGAAIVLAFVFLFGVEYGMLQLIMTALVAGCIGLLFGVIVEFSQPYGGLIRVSPAAWSEVIQQNGLTRAAR